MFSRKVLGDNWINAPEPVPPPSTVRQWLSDNAKVGNNTAIDSSWIK